MKYHFMCLIELFKTKFYKLFIIFILIYLMLLLTAFLSNYEMNLSLFNSLVGTSFNTSFGGILWMLYQVGFHVYIFFSAFNYEKDNSFEFLILRKSYSSFMRTKIIVTAIFAILFRVFFFFITFLFFKTHIEFPIVSFFLNLLLYFAVPMLITLFLCFFNLRDYKKYLLIKD